LIRDENAVVFPEFNSTTVHVWNISSDAETRNFTSTGSPYVFYPSEDGLTVATTSDYMNYTCYDTKTGTVSGMVALNANGREGPFVVTKNYSYTADKVSSVNVIRVTKLADGTSTIKLLASTGGYLASIAASRDESTLAAYAGTTIRIWKLK
jgi:hypothetical protein